MTFATYIKHLTAQIRLHGKGAIKYAHHPRSLQLGFTSPDWEWLIGINALKAATPQGEWRENTSLIENYKKIGGQTPLIAMTRTTHQDMIKFFVEQVNKAIENGESLRAKDLQLH